MTDNLPPHLESNSSRKNLDEYSDLLEELAKIRKDIEQESLPSCHLPALDQNHSIYQNGNNFSSISGENSSDRSSNLDSFRRLYRFDFEHLGKVGLGNPNVDSANSDFAEWTNNDTVIPLSDKESQSQLRQVNEQRENYSPQSKRSGSRQKYYRYDDGPVLIPIRRPDGWISSQKSKSAEARPHESVRRSHDNIDQNNVAELTALSWGMISQYENERFANVTANAGNLSLFIGWGAIASGVVIFARSFFVGSMIWLVYGLPVIALGAVCLFLGIILSILSDKMQHINDLKQSLTAHRILNQPNKKTNPPVNHNDHAGLNDVHDRLVKLRSEINVLIDECENP